MAGKRNYRLTREAEADIEAILEFTLNQFGTAQFAIYRDLLADAFAALAGDPARIGTKPRPELGKGVSTFHLHHMARRHDAASHFIVFTVDAAREIKIVRILHESMDLARHVRRTTSDEFGKKT
ncbi:MAG: type II toxin-antitoxin system RelE/ParE family toxin [Rhodospirillaceae bacterium]|nr:type II toxin-antitoxin system RelE/ParE family toxin [Rhodospirillaceae bacterium]